MHHYPYELRMRPDLPPVSREAFVNLVAAGSVNIAADGFALDGQPWIDPAGGLICVDHHSPDLPRWAVMASCQQLHMLLKLRAIQAMLRMRPKLVLWLNDPDPDASMCHFLCKHLDIAESVQGACLGRLVTVMARLDESGGAFPYPASSLMLPIINGLTAPYWEARFSGELDRRSPQLFRLIADTIAENVLNYVIGNQVEQKPADTRYRLIARQDEFALVEELGPQAIQAIARDGIDVCFALRVRPDGRRVCSVKRLNPAADFDPATFYRLANEREPQANEAWGGSDCGGSPRVAGTGLEDLTILALAEASRYTCLTL